MIKQIELKNFKAFAENGAIAELAPITIICGQNSAGKSSIIQSLLMLSQTIQLQDNNLDAPDIVTSGKFIDLGNFNSLLNSHDHNKNLEISLTFTNKNSKIWRKKPLDNDSKISLLFESSHKKNDEKDGNYFGRLKNIKFSITNLGREIFNLKLNRIDENITLNNSENNLSIEDKKFSFDKFTDFFKILLNLPQTAIEMHLYRRMQKQKRNTIRDKLLSEYKHALDNSAPKIHIENILNQLKNFNTDEDKLDKEDFSSLLTGDLHYKTVNKLKSYELTNRDTLMSQRRGVSSYLPSSFNEGMMDRDPTLAEIYMKRICSFINDFNINMNNTLGQLSYLGPLRAAPQRSYSYKLGKAYSVGNSGEDIIQILRIIVNERKSNKKLIQDYLNDECAQLDIPYKFHTTLKSDVVAGDLVILNVTDIRTNTTVALTDVGFGISQLLPIIVQAIYLYEKSNIRKGLILVEQPELHLHPNLQAKIADFILRKSQPNENKEGVQWIIETHSESLIRRLQKRVKEKLIKPEDISFLYVDKIDSIGSVIKRLRLDEDGDFIDSWPNGFFVDAFSDLLGD